MEARMRKSLVASLSSGAGLLLMMTASSPAFAAAGIAPRAAIAAPEASVVKIDYYRGYRRCCGPRHYYRGPRAYGYYPPAPAYYAPPVVYYPPPVVYYPPPVVYGAYPPVAAPRYYGAYTAGYDPEYADW